MQINGVTEHIGQLCRLASLTGKVTKLLPCHAGGNNRTFRLEIEDKVFALKYYFREPSDKRDRLASEFAFLQFADQVCPGIAPTPYACLPEAGLALYEFIEGERMTSAAPSDVSSAAAFFCALNDPAWRVKAAHLPLASEACFSLREHLNLIDGRIARLKEIEPHEAEDKLAIKQIAALASRWEAVSEAILHQASEWGLDINQLLPEEQRCVSPSDFGFHNALRMADGRIRFLDFEYAGWDDPAKMTGDFFAQLAVPVSSDYFDSFVNDTMVLFPDSGALMLRACLLKRVYQIKWCCIALNVFIPVHLQRRRFANPDLDIAVLKNAQLAKAKTLLQQVVI